MKYEIILFDVDDTLFDFPKAEAHALSSSFEEFGIQDKDAAFVTHYHTINKQLWNEYEQGLITPGELKVERFNRFISSNNLGLNAVDFSNRFLNYLGEGAFLLDGAAELCNHLCGQCRLAVITNGFREVQLSRIQKAGIADCFEHIIVSEETGYQKPHIGIFDYAFQKLNISDHSKVLIVGDSLTSDIQGGINYGIDTCWYNPLGKHNTTAIKPTYEIKQLSELLTII
ncbi:MAG: YjjG family noncanonical pyrimidine nucleotidase [Candidatus Pristimantibacillus sp.]